MASKEKLHNVTAVAVGCGDRAATYCSAAYDAGLPFKVIAAVDPDENRLRLMREKYGVAADMCFKKIEDVLAKGRIADCVINGTMDQLHLKTSLPFLEQGYNMLLEKPIVNNAADLMKIHDTANKHGCKLMICHVLRYAPFYRKAKELIDAGEIGEIVHMETSERVGVAHSSVSFIRGKWNNESVCGSSYMLAKCCHDIDLLCWFNNKTAPVTADSFGGRNFIIPEKAPKGAGTRCLVDCPAAVRENCKFNAKPIYLDHDGWQIYAWQTTGKNYWDVTPAEREESLKTDNPHGLCAYKVKSDLIDHQTLTLQFGNGSTATHMLLSAAARGSERRLFIAGTKGEIEGFAGDNKFLLTKYNPATSGHTETVFDITADGAAASGHYGGDAALMKDFIDLMRGGKPSVSCTSIDDSINGHLCVYAADAAMKDGRRTAVLKK